MLFSVFYRRAVGKFNKSRRGLAFSTRRRQEPPEGRGADEDVADRQMG